MKESHLDALNPQIQHLVDSRVDEGEVDPRQTGEHQLFRNLVDQRDTETFLQVHQNLLTTQTEKTGTWRWIKVSGEEWRQVALCHVVTHTNITYLIRPLHSIELHSFL